MLEKPLNGGRLGLFAWGNGAVDFSDFRMAPRSGKLFVVMPFSSPYKELHEEVIKPVAKEFHLDAYHGGEVFRPGVILQDIEQSIADAKVLIANITPENEAYNPNVFYEVGYAHGLHKPVILLAERERVKRPPFDINQHRVLYYDNTIAGKIKAEVELRKYLEEALLGRPPKSAERGSDS